MSWDITSAEQTKTFSGASIDQGTNISKIQFNTQQNAVENVCKMASILLRSDRQVNSRCLHACCFGLGIVRDVSIKATSGALTVILYLLTSNFGPWYWKSIYLWMQCCKGSWADDQSTDLLHHSHNAPLTYPTIYHFVTQMCPCCRRVRLGCLYIAL